MAEDCPMGVATSQAGDSAMEALLALVVGTVAVTDPAVATAMEARNLVIKTGPVMARAEAMDR